MRDSACRWFIIKKAKYFGVMLNIFELSGVWEMSNLDWSMQISFFKLPRNIFSTDIIKQR